VLSDVSTRFFIYIALNLSASVLLTVHTHELQRLNGVDKIDSFASHVGLLSCFLYLYHPSIAVDLFKQAPPTCVNHFQPALDSG